jgi:hypothetical protein
MHWIFVAVLMLELRGALVNYNWWDTMVTESSPAILVLYFVESVVAFDFQERSTTCTSCCS